MAEVYDIYHDESQEEAYWHGFLFVPRSERKYLLDLLIKSRKGANWGKPISFKEINKRTGNRSPRVRLIEPWLSIALASLQQQKFLSLPTPFYLCGKPPCYFRSLDRLIKCKFVIFKEKDKHKKMFFGLDGLACIETTFRMGIKGGIHRLFNEKEPIIIGNVYIDGDEHYIKWFGRHFDVKRSLRRFAAEMKPYVSFIRGAKLIPQRSDHRKIKPTQNTDDSQFLQLCDILLGGVRFHSYCPNSRHIKYKISSPCKVLLERETTNLPRMRQSRFFNAFILGEAWLENNEWQFAPLKLGEDKALPKVIQLKLHNF
jgi:hypothetical protein